MRFLRSLLLSSSLIVTAGCAMPDGAKEAGPITEATPGTSSFSPPPEASLQAASIGRRLLEAPGFKWIGSPRPVLIEEMSYAEAVQRVGVGEGRYEIWPRETRVWLVIFEGRWELMPLGPPQATLEPLPYEGCLLVVFTAGDGTFISAGDAVCPSQP